MDRRLKTHPILNIPARSKVMFTFANIPMMAYEDEVISSALFANGVSVFSRHERDGSPQGIFCANGQCAMCMVIADGRPVKACMEKVKPGVIIEPCNGWPRLPAEDAPVGTREIETLTCQVLIVGAGPAGLCAAAELGKAGFDVLIIDDKSEIGGKLSLQTHAFFGSIRDCYAGTRGIDIATILGGEIASLPNVRLMLETMAAGIFFDKKIGAYSKGRYILIEPQAMIVAAGAREKALSFPGGDLPGVYGAGAFQTLLNRDRVRPTDRLFIVGGGNVGLIGGYHALQAGIKVLGLVEALPKVGGYKVHLDKLKRFGVPVWLSHTVTAAHGREHLDAVTIAAIDDHFRPIRGTERSFEVDTLLIAVGLSPVNELVEKALAYGMTVLSAGDSDEIAEASAAVFSGRIAGRRMAEMLGRSVRVPARWEETAAVLKSKPGALSPFAPKAEKLSVYPVIRCVEEIPCNPCTQVCPVSSITIPEGGIMGLPIFQGKCLGCGRCVLVCPGLAVVLVMEDYDPAKGKALLMMPFEFEEERIPLGSEVFTVDMEGNLVGRGRVVAFRNREDQDRRRLVLVEVPYEERLAVAGFRIQEPEHAQRALSAAIEQDYVVCRCERVLKSEIVKEIRAGVRDLNTLKAVCRAGMGTCAGRTCTDFVLRIFREEGVPLDEVVSATNRPFTAEIPLSAFAGIEEDGESK
jgi:NADPH-dependent 2,4-dienoyl-CoA reductase/sulfur reductase-like enzyme/Fe-S-cluster-containing hydrogenase component 2